MTTCSRRAVALAKTSFRGRATMFRRLESAVFLTRAFRLEPRRDETRVTLIFGPFRRAVSDHHYGGFGVGLWIAQQIVEAHRGSIVADSSPGEGATFTVRLPCGSPEPA